jgi:hypothetical protein
VQDGIIKVKDYHGLLLAEKLLDVLLLLQAQQLPTDQDTLGRLLVKQIAPHFVNVLLGYLLHAELTPTLHDFLVPTNHPSQSHDNCGIIGLAFMLFPFDEEGGFGEVRHANLDLIRSGDLSG